MCEIRRNHDSMSMLHFPNSGAGINNGQWPREACFAVGSYDLSRVQYLHSLDVPGSPLGNLSAEILVGILGGDLFTFFRISLKDTEHH